MTHPEAEAAARNAVVTEMNRLWDEKTGDATWKRESGYHARSRVESDRFLDLGRCESYAVLSVGNPVT